MTNDPQTLQEVAQTAADLHEGSAGRYMEELARRAGLNLSRTTFDKMLRGNYRSRPSRETVRALAYVAQLPEVLVAEVAGLPRLGGDLAEQLPPGHETLTAEQQSAVIAVVRQYVKANQALADARRATEEVGDRAGSAPKTRAGNTPAPKTTVLRAPNGGVTTAQDIRTRVRREARLREGSPVPGASPAAQRDKHLAKADEATHAGQPERAAYHRVYAEAWQAEADALANPGRPAEFLREHDDELPDFTQLAARNRGRMSDAERLAQQQDDEGETP